MRMSFLSLALLLALPATANATELSGTWQRANGNSLMTFAPCPGGICGKITWLKPGVKTKAHIGQKIYYGMVRYSAKSWKGKAFSPKDNRTSDGSLTVEGKNLISKECILGGRICKSETWTRIG